MAWRTPDFLAYDPERHDALAGDHLSADYPVQTFRLDRPRTCTTGVSTAPPVASHSSDAAQDHDPRRALRVGGVAPLSHESRPGRIRDGS